MAQEHYCMPISMTGSEFDPHSRELSIYLNVYFHFFALVTRRSAALISATQKGNAFRIPGKWGT